MPVTSLMVALYLIIKDKLLAVAQGDIWLGSIPMLDGHIWDSLFRVIVAMGFGILLGVPLGIYMGVSRFFKSFFDPLIELYRPVPPLAWAPLILTIFGIRMMVKFFCCLWWPLPLWYFRPHRGIWHPTV